MSSLTQLFGSHERLLVLDAASTRVQVGLLQAGAPARWQSIADEAGTGLFVATEAVLKEAGTTLGDVGAFAFCEGPGSMLGIRTVAMAVRTWQVLKPRPAFAYQSLAVAARFAWTSAPRPLAVIADARRDSWHMQPISPDGSLGALQRISAAELPAGELLTPENFRAWAALPRPAAMCSYDLAKILPAVAGIDLFREMLAPDAFQHEAPAYKKWSAQVHSSATALPR
jgi:tRNA threonylcarbamoyladenosine biosynthesis protein TsaB